MLKPEQVAEAVVLVEKAGASLRPCLMDASGDDIQKVGQLITHTERLARQIKSLSQPPQAARPAPPRPPARVPVAGVRAPAPAPAATPPADTVTTDAAAAAVAAVVPIVVS
jgi:hypothetical protein